MLVFAGLSTIAMSADPRSLDPQVVTSAVASIAKGEPVRIVDGAGGYLIYGASGSGRVVSTAGGFRIYYKDRSANVVRTIGGWKIYPN
jgi:hypothetical protein